MYRGLLGARRYAGKVWNHNALVSKCRRCVDGCQSKNVYWVVVKSAGCVVSNKCLLLLAEQHKCSDLVY